jgi:4'-phosphopantetheinyl transferase
MSPAPTNSVSVFKFGTVEIVVAPLNVPPRALHRYSLDLSEDERQRAGRYAFEREWRRFVVARGRLRQLLGERLGARPQDIAFTYGKHGKPALARPYSHSGLSFNLAHSGDLAVYAFAQAQELGVDVEAMRPLADADGIASRFFSATEKQAYQTLASCHRRTGFFNCWTRKEAFVKALGDGLSHALEDFDVSLAPGEPARILRVADTPGDACGWRLESFVPAPGFVGALVTETARARGALTASVSAQALP